MNCAHRLPSLDAHFSGRACSAIGRKPTMRTIEINVPPGIGAEQIEQALLEAGLVISMRGTLKKFPGSLHWHAKNGRAPGTLEVTLWPNEGRAWFNIQSGRNAPWIEDKMGRITRAIAALHPSDR